MLEEDKNKNAVALLQASIGELTIIDLACDAIGSKLDERIDVELAIVAPRSGAVAGALARMGISAVYAAVERLIATFARDKMLDLRMFADLLGADADLPGVWRFPALRQSVPGVQGAASLQEGCEKLEELLLKEFRNAGLHPDAQLMRQIVALKQLRNECAHVEAKKAAATYLAGAGFPPSSTLLTLHDLQLALNTLAGVLRMLAGFWPDEQWSRQRVDLISDLPIYIGRLEAKLGALADASSRSQ